MNLDSDHDFETDLDRALKALPELEAPAGMVPRVMAAIALREAAPWHRLPWHAWPPVLRAVSLVVLLAAFGGFLAATWQLTHAAGRTETMAELRGLLSGAGVIWRALDILAGSMVMAVKQLGAVTLGLIACSLALAYATCVGAGALFWRLAWNRN